MSNGIQQLTFHKETYPDVLEVANELAGLEQRKPHDSIRLLILEFGKSKIQQLKLVCQANNSGEAGEGVLNK